MSKIFCTFRDPVTNFQSDKNQGRENSELSEIAAYISQNNKYIVLKKSKAGEGMFKTDLLAEFEMHVEILKNDGIKVPPVFFENLESFKKTLKTHK